MYSTSSKHTQNILKRIFTSRKPCTQCTQQPKKSEISAFFGVHMERIRMYTHIHTCSKMYTDTRKQLAFEYKKCVLSMCEYVRFLGCTQEKTAYFRHFLHVAYIEHVILLVCIWADVNQALSLFDFLDLNIILFRQCLQIQFKIFFPFQLSCRP